MIGPKRPGDTIRTYADWGLTVPTLPGWKVIDLADDSTVILHSTTVLAIGGNAYRAQFVLDDPGDYAVVWDDNGGAPFFSDEIWIADVLVINAASVPGGGGVLPPYTSANPLRMKRYDTEPTLELQLTLPNDVDPYPIPAGAEVWFTVQPQSQRTGGFALAPLIHKQMTIDDAPNGMVSYEWLPTDLTFYGDFLLEMEVNLLDGGVKSFPGADHDPPYIPFVILPDEDPAITP